MTRILINPDETVDAAAVSAWSLSLLGGPKMTVVCGHCGSTWRTRDYYPLRDRGRLLHAKCPQCEWWNNTKLVFA